MTDPFMNQPPRVWPDSPRKVRGARLKTEVMTEADAHLAARGMHDDFPAAELDYRGQFRDVLAWFNGTPTIDPDRWCRTCEQQRWAVWCIQRKANGLQLSVLLCLACGHKMLERGYREADGHLPTWRDSIDITPCAHCGDCEGVEEHHWAPKHLFDDYHKWPTAMLCPSCHREWHRVVTPNMHRRAAS